MRVAVVGAGYVGLVSGACFSEFGHDVICVDVDADKIEKLERGVMPIYEPGLDALVATNLEAGRLAFSTDLRAAVEDAQAVFIAVGTPSRRGDGHADLSYVFQAASDIADSMRGYTLVVMKSTVPVGTGGEVARLIRARRPDAEFDVVSNPEFLREGSAIEDFMRPDRVVIGVESDRAKENMSALYRPLFLLRTPTVFTTIKTAELIKYAANAFLATKITFINEIADLCENLGADVGEVAIGIGMDNRIGGKFLHAGPGFGGSCFPKDTQALLKIAEDVGIRLGIVGVVKEVNDHRKSALADRVVEACGGSVQGQTIAVLGLAFKPRTDDVRDSPALDLVAGLQAAGARIQAFDPKAMDEAAKELSDVIYAGNAYEAIENADAVVIVTEWNEFRALDLARITNLLRRPVMVDLRNIYEPEEAARQGLHYTSIGRPKALPAAVQVVTDAPSA